MDQFLAEIRMFPFNFAPKGWAWCDGFLLPISQNTALFSLLGTTYGGDGKSTFQLPDLQGRSPMHPGQGDGLTERFLGESGGEAEVTLREEHLPPHSHASTVRFARDGEAVTARPTNAMPGINRAEMYTTDAGPATSIIGVGNPGQVVPHNNRMPYLTVHFCIALQGIFPQRW